jgi:hypothetical protein
MKKQTYLILFLAAAVVAAGSVLVRHNHARHTAGHDHSTHSHPPGHAAAWRMEFHNPAPLVAGVAAELNLHLWDSSGRLLTFADLAIAHEQKLHLLIVDETLSDYHHLHPVEEKPGKFVTSFTPRAGGRYIAFADVVDAATGVQHYVRAEMISAGAVPIPDRAITSESVVDGYRFSLRLPPGLSAAGGGHAEVRITDRHGAPVKSLEPVMGAFAHGVGFTERLDGVLHVHPHGREPRTATERGGPKLAFHLNPARPGFHRLYVQVRIDGHDRFASFGLDVAP